MRTIILAITIACPILALDSASSQREHVLDLTVPGVIFTAPPPEGGGVAFSGQQTRQLPLDLTLQQVDRGEYRFGDDVTYEVTLRNASNTTVALPWSADLAMIYGSGKPSVRAGLSLAIEEAGSANARLGILSLAGSPAVYESILYLAPKEKAIIRAKRAVRLQPDLAGRVAGLGITKVRAEFTLWTDDSVLWQPLLSKNSLPVQFRLRADR